MLRIPLLLLIVALGSAAPWRGAVAQKDAADSAEAGARWHFSDLRKGFCIQMLLDPAKLERELPQGVRLRPAEGDTALHPALRRVVASQPEYRSWSPSSLCFYYLGRVDGGSRSISGSTDPAKAPVLGVWTVATEGGEAGRGNLALELRSNDGDLRDAGRDANLDFERLRTEIGGVPREDGPPRPEETRYQVRYGKTLLVWDGRAGEDTTRVAGPVSSRWWAVGRRGGRMMGELTLKPAFSTMMVGSLRVEGKDPMATVLKASPIRYVGPAYEGGDGELRIGR